MTTDKEFDEKVQAYSKIIIDEMIATSEKLFEKEQANINGCVFQIVSSWLLSNCILMLEENKYNPNKMIIDHVQSAKNMAAQTIEERKKIKSEH